MAGKIFISYRRDDSAAHALNIAQYLERAFGHSRVFIDVDHIKLGENFETILDQKLAECKVLLAIIGPTWASSADRDGRRRLDDPNDWVRMEIAHAIKRRITVIPVLVAGAAELPKPHQLPVDLEPLLKRQAATITTNGFRYEMSGLASDIRGMIGADHRRTMLAGAATAAFVTAVVLAALITNLFGTSSTAIITAGFESQLTAKCKTELAAWRKTMAVAAFAMASNGECGTSSNMTQLKVARTAALEDCASHGSDCKIVELTEGDWALKPSCEAAYSTWKSQGAAKAFAVSRSGDCAVSVDQKQIEDARSAALAECERLSGNCRLHDVDQGNWDMIGACKKDFEAWKVANAARAFAVARNGACGQAYNYSNLEAASKQALIDCAEGGTECRVVDSFEGNWEIGGDCTALANKWRTMRGRASFAVGQTGDICGYSYGWSNSTDADKEALRQCRDNDGSSCKVVGRH